MSLCFWVEMSSHPNSRNPKLPLGLNPLGAPLALQDSSAPSTVAPSLVLAVTALLLLSLPGAISCGQAFLNSCWDEPGMSQDSPWPWVLMSGYCLWGALGTSSMASCAPHPRVHPILTVQCPQGDAHTLCVHNGMIWDRRMAKGQREQPLGVPGAGSRVGWLEQPHCEG